MRRINLPTKEDLHSVCSINSGLVIVGDNGTMIHLNPTTLELTVIPVDRKICLVSVCSFESGTSIVAIGDSETMIHWTVGDFKATEIELETTRLFRSVCPIKEHPGQVVVVGPMETIIFCNVTSEPHIINNSTPNVPFRQWLSSVCQDSSGTFYAVGNRGAMICWDQGDSVVTRFFRGTRQSLKSVCSIEQKGIVAVGDEGIMLWYHRDQIKIIPTGTDECLTSICSSSESIIAVGTNGTMIQWHIGDDEAKPLKFLSIPSKGLNSICSFGILNRAFIVVGNEGTAFVFGLPWSIQDHNRYIPVQRNKIMNILLSIESFQIFLSVTSFF